MRCCLGYRACQQGMDRCSFHKVSLIESGCLTSATGGLHMTCITAWAARATTRARGKGGDACAVAQAPQPRHEWLHHQAKMGTLRLLARRVCLFVSMSGWHRRCCASALPSLAEAMPKEAGCATAFKGLAFLLAGCTPVRY